MAQTDPTRLVFVDECGTHTSMTRRRARAPHGMRARGAVPRNRGPVTTLIAGLSLAGMVPAMTVEGGTTAAVFAAYLEQVLLPALRPGQVVVVDNVGAHKPDRMRVLVEAAGCRLVFLPPTRRTCPRSRRPSARSRPWSRPPQRAPGAPGRGHRRAPGAVTAATPPAGSPTPATPPPNRLKTAV
jgi:hypothetical protein